MLADDINSGLLALRARWLSCPIVLQIVRMLGAADRVGRYPMGVPPPSNGRLSMSDGLECSGKPQTVAMFTTTQWSVIPEASDTVPPRVGQAIAQRCRVYWYPLYACVRCALTVLEQVLARLRGEFEAAGRLDLFEQLRPIESLREGCGT